MRSKISGIKSVMVSVVRKSKYAVKPPVRKNSIEAVAVPFCPSVSIATEDMHIIKKHGTYSIEYGTYHIDTAISAGSKQKSTLLPR